MSKTRNIIENTVHTTGSGLGNEIGDILATEIAPLIPDAIQTSAISHTLKGTFDLSNTVTTLGFDAVTYTAQTTSVNATYYTGAGNAFAYATDTLRHGDFFWNNTGSTQTINVYDVFNAITSTVDVANNNGYLNTGISSVDFTVSGNGSGYWLDRSVNQVKTDAGAVVASGEVEVNTSKVHVKSRSIAYSHVIIDGLRGSQNDISSDLTSAEDGRFASIVAVINGIVLGSGSTSNIRVNQSGATYIAYQTLYTHIKWGTTNQGKFQIEAYNPVTNEGMIYYIGSGVAGHQISHSQGVELDYTEIKALEVANGWQVNVKDVVDGDYSMYLSETNTRSLDTNATVTYSQTYTSIDTSGRLNTSNQEYIMYYKCKSETFTIGTYTGTGVAGNFVETKDVNGIARKPRRVIIKRIDTVGNWYVFDTKRGEVNYILLDASSVESTFSEPLKINSNGFTWTLDDGNGMNVSNGQYLYIVEFDTNADNNGSYFDKATDTTNLQATDVYASISNGYGANGASNVIVNKVGSIIPTNDWQGV